MLGPGLDRGLEQLDRMHDLGVDPDAASPALSCIVHPGFALATTGRP